MVDLVHICVQTCCAFLGTERPLWAGTAWQPALSCHPGPCHTLGPNEHAILACLGGCAAWQVSGQKFYYLRNAGALLELALVNWAMSKVVARHGYTPVMTPDLVKAGAASCCQSSCPALDVDTHRQSCHG